MCIFMYVIMFIDNMWYCGNIDIGFFCNIFNGWFYSLFCMYYIYFIIIN